VRRPFGDSSSDVAQEKVGHEATEHDHLPAAIDVVETPRNTPDGHAKKDAAREQQEPAKAVEAGGAMHRRQALKSGGHRHGVGYLNSAHPEDRGISTDLVMMAQPRYREQDSWFMAALDLGRACFRLFRVRLIPRQRCGTKARWQDIDLPRRRLAGKPGAHLANW